MNMNMMKTPAALALLCTLSAPALADNFDVKVAGKITPPACTPSLGNGGIFDYGDIPVSSLSSTDYTVLGERTTNFSIQCKSPTIVGINATNNRPGTLAGSNEEGPDHVGFSPVTMAVSDVVIDPDFPTAAGLGLTPEGKPIGGYTIAVKRHATADGASVKKIHGGSIDQTSWGARPWSGMLYYPTFDMFGFWSSESGSSAPIAFKTLSTTLSVNAYINKASELNLTQPVLLDGSTTIEMVYP